MDDTWTARDLPVLDAAARFADAEPIIGGTLAEIADDTGLDVEDVDRAVHHLENAGLVETRRVMGPPGYSSVSKVYGPALQLVGAWPTPEAAADRLIEALTTQIAAAATPDERSRLTAIRDGLLNIAHDILVKVATQTLTGSI